MKTVLITGANRGIGLEHVRRFAERGAHVFATARSLADAKELKALIAAREGPVSVDACVAGQQRLLDSLTPGNSGRFFNYDGKELPW